MSTKDKSKIKYSKQDFLTILSSMSIEEINRTIKEKGKQPKLINPIIILK